MSSSLPLAALGCACARPRTCSLHLALQGLPSGVPAGAKFLLHGRHARCRLPSSTRSLAAATSSRQSCQLPPRWPQAATTRQAQWKRLSWTAVRFSGTTRSRRPCWSPLRSSCHAHRSNFCQRPVARARWIHHQITAVRVDWLRRAPRCCRAVKYAGRTQNSLARLWPHFRCLRAGNSYRVIYPAPPCRLLAAASKLGHCWTDPFHRHPLPRCGKIRIRQAHGLPSIIRSSARQPRLPRGMGRHHSAGFRTSWRLAAPALKPRLQYARNCCHGDLSATSPC